MPKTAKRKTNLRQVEVRMVDRAMGMVSIIGPASASPQVIEIFAKQSAQGVSLLSWVMYLMLGVVSLSYGLFHKLKPIIVSQVLWLVMDIVVIVGILMYSRGVVPSVSFDMLVLLNTIGKAMVIVSFGFGFAALGSYVVFLREKS